MWQDLRYGARMLLRQPGFTLVAVLTLALGIGATTAIFSVVNGVLLKPLPYAEPGRLVRVFERSRTQPKFPMSPGNFLDYRARSGVFDGLALYVRDDLELSARGRPERLSAMSISSGFLGVLGFRPALGRDFRREEELPGRDRVVVLSDRLWQRSFGADPQVIGQSVTLSGNPYTIIGVMPPGVQHVGGDYRSLPHGESVDLWRPLTLEPGKAVRFAHYLNAVGRLKAGVTREAAEAELNVIAARLGEEFPNSNKGWEIRVSTLHEEIVGGARRALLLLLGAVGCVLLISCVNVASLSLARAAARERETGVRAALGAGRWRLMRLTLAESLLLALGGGAGGWLLALWAVDLLVTIGPSQLPRLHAVGVDARMLLFTLGVTVLTALIFGLAPAWQNSKANLNEVLKESGRGASGSRRQRRLRGALVVAEVALAVVLLVGAGLLLRSFLRLQQADPGFRPEGVLTMSLALPQARYPKGPERVTFYERLIARVAGLPGVRAAGATSDLPWTGYDENLSFNIEGRTFPPNEGPGVRYHHATPDYFRAVGVPLLAGRFFGVADQRDSPPVILINGSAARRYWPDGDAVGSRITFSNQPKDGDWMTVVGVVGDVKDYPHAAEAEPALYWPHAQQPQRGMILAVRSDADAGGLGEAVRREVAALDPELAVAEVRALEEIAVAAVAGQRFTLLLTGLFAGAALLLAAVGIYGVMAYAVTQRTHEIGVRMAVGAQTRNVLGLVIGQGMRMALAGLGLGLIAAFGMTRVMVALLYEVSATDPTTFAGIALLLMIVALVASYVPARRAANVDPVVALRNE